MVEANRTRRANDLRDLASAVAFAMHEPRLIEKHIRAPTKASERLEGDFETAKWWRGG